VAALIADESCFDRTNGKKCQLNSLTVTNQKSQKGLKDIDICFHGSGEEISKTMTIFT